MVACCLRIILWEWNYPLELRLVGRVSYKENELPRLSSSSLTVASQGLGREKLRGITATEKRAIHP